MNKTSAWHFTKIWLKRLLVITLVVALATLLWFEIQMREAKGQFTPAIDTGDLLTIGGEFIIKDIHILDPDGNAMVANQDVLIADGLIQQIGTDLPHPAVMKVIEGQGQYLIPGLMDGHVHLNETMNNLWLFVANGVTHVRDMAGDDHQLMLREQTAQPLWPDVFVSSMKVYDTPWWQVLFREWAYSRITISHAEQGSDIVNDLVDQGFDAIKISSGLTPEQYHSLVNAAHEAGLLVTGHIPATVSLDEVLAAGQQEIAHVEELTKVFAREYDLPISQLNPATAAEYLAYVQQRSQEVAPALKAQDIHITSVIWLMESLVQQKLQLEQFLTTVELAYVNPVQVEGWLMKAGWLPGHHSYATSPYWLQTPENKQKIKLYWDTYVDAIHIMTRTLVEHGVEFTAGTDAVTTGAVPGFSLHDELESMVKLGMTPAQALQSATRIPGQWLDRINKTPKGGPVGQIKAGYQANLVILKHNPLENISHTRSIQAVINKGHLLNRTQLDTILHRIKNLNNQQRTQDITPYQ